MALAHVWDSCPAEQPDDADARLRSLFHSMLSLTERRAAARYRKNYGAQSFTRAQMDAMLSDSTVPVTKRPRSTV